MDKTVKKTLLRIINSTSKEVIDTIAVEKRLRILVNGKEVLSLYCTPIMLKELVVGILSTEDIIRGQWCAEGIALYYGEEVKADVTAEGTVDVSGGVKTSGCAGGVVFPEREKALPTSDPLTISAEKLRELYSKFQTLSELYKLTGCVHSAALADTEEILCMAEDIGRHNAVDKVIGYCLIEDIGFKGKIMLTSGRLTSEILSKCSRWGIPIVVSKTAPTDLAISIAEKNALTTVGFLRGRRFNVYTHPERIL
ncbi:MAG: formate dehydrogenase accessory sulfurtransferase FdhD [Nitrospirae bacterium]|nr:formate dehydrogenase accessory sulfurtransferase FdhD [Nitrospirota bacterium]